MTDLRELLKQIRQWDALDIPDTDGEYWKRRIDAALEKSEQEQEQEQEPAPPSLKPKEKYD